MGPAGVGVAAGSVGVAADGVAEDARIEEFIAEGLMRLLCLTGGGTARRRALADRNDCKGIRLATRRLGRWNCVTGSARDSRGLPICCGSLSSKRGGPMRDGVTTLDDTSTDGMREAAGPEVRSGSEEEERVARPERESCGGAFVAPHAQVSRKRTETFRIG